MKVLHVIPSLARSSGGPAEVVRRIVPALRDLGVDVVVVTTDKDLTHIDEDVREMTDTTVVRAWARRWSFAPGLVLPVWRALRDADIVHVHSVHTFPTTITLALARLRCVPAILQPHGALNGYHFRQKSAVKRLYFAVIDGFGLGGTRSALYSSRVEMRDGEAALPGVPAAWLPLGVDAKLLEASRASTVVPSILFLSRIAKKKRLDILLQSLVGLNRNDLAWEAHIAGPVDADLTYDPEAMCDALGLTGRVRFHGPVNSDARLSLLSRADIFVLPSDDESFGMAAAEAMAAGCAVVASHGVGAASDAEGSGGVCLTDQSVESVSSAIERLLRDDAERSSLGERGRVYAQQNLDWNRIAVRLTAYYRKATRDEVASSHA